MTRCSNADNVQDVFDAHYSFAGCDSLEEYYKDSNPMNWVETETPKWTCDMDKNILTPPSHMDHCLLLSNFFFERIPKIILQNIICTISVCWYNILVKRITIIYILGGKLRCGGCCCWGWGGSLTAKWGRPRACTSWPGWPAAAGGGCSCWSADSHHFGSSTWPVASCMWGYLTIFLSNSSWAHSNILMLTANLLWEDS